MHIRMMIALVALTVLAAVQSTPAVARCGRGTPHPAVAPIRPAFASPGDTVTLLSPPAFDLHVETALADAPDGPISRTLMQWNDTCDRDDVLHDDADGDKDDESSAPGSSSRSSRERVTRHGRTRRGAVAWLVANEKPHDGTH